MWIGLCPGGVQLMLVNILQSPIFAAIVVIVNIVARNPTLRVIISLVTLQIIALIFMRYYTKCNKIQIKEEVEKELLEKVKLTAVVTPQIKTREEMERVKLAAVLPTIIPPKSNVESNINISNNVDNVGDNEDDTDEEIVIESNLEIEEDDEVVDEMVIGSHRNSSYETFMEKNGIISGSKIIYSSFDEEEGYTRDVEAIERPKFKTENLSNNNNYDDEEEDYTQDIEAIARPKFMTENLSSSNDDYDEEEEEEYEEDEDYKKV
jgi:hypothetical protein